MSLLDEIAAVSGDHRERCSLATIMAVLDEQARADLDVLLTTKADGRYVYRGVHIARVLTGRGHRVTGQTVQRHRRDDCSCTSR